MTHYRLKRLLFKLVTDMHKKSPQINTKTGIKVDCRLDAAFAVLWSLCCILMMKGQLISWKEAREQPEILQEQEKAAMSPTSFVHLEMNLYRESTVELLDSNILPSYKLLFFILALSEIKINKKFSGVNKHGML